MAIDLEQVRNHYSQMDDSRLERIAKYDIASLEPEVEEIVIAELKKRNFDESILSGIAAQTKEYDDEEIEELLDKVKSLACPKCGTQDKDLVGGIVRKVRGYIIMTKYERRPLIACRPCIEEERKSQLIKNSLFGWWGIPWGLLYNTPHAIINHFRDNRIKEELSESILLDFVGQNIGELKTNWMNQDYLTDFIHHQNTKRY